MTTSELEGARREFCVELARVKHRAGELGLFITMHRLDEAVRMVGFEVAGTPEVCEKIERAREKSKR